MPDKETLRLEPKDFARIRRVGDPQLSPDGKTLVYAVEWIDQEDDKKYVNLWLMDIDEGEPRRLTVGKQRDTDPRWCPDGSRVAFLSDRSDKKQIWLIDAAGGEAWRLKTEEVPSSPVAWSPDGTALAFCSRLFEPPEEWSPYPGAPRGERQRAIKQAEPEGDEDISDVRVINRLRFRFDGAGFLGDKRSQVMVVAAAGPEEADDIQPRRLTDGDYDHAGPLSWSPDGRYVAFTALRRDDADQLQKNDLWAVDVVTERLVHLMDGLGMVSSPLWSPDGDHLAFVGHDRAYGSSTTTCLWVLPVDLNRSKPLSQSEATNLTAQLDRPVGRSVSSDVRYASSAPQAQWHQDGEQLYFIAADSGASQLYRTDISNGKVEKILQEPGGVITAFSLGPDDQVIYQAGTSDTPEDLWLRSAGGERCQLTSVNGELLQELWTQRAERFRYESCDGTEIEGFLLKPRGYEQGRRYPTVLFIHGGPHGAYGSAFMFQCQVMASAGMAVVYTNPRGSQTYGQEFAYQVVEDWGGGDYRDIMLGVDEIIDQGIADPRRLGVTGWSYGGYMTSWVVTQTDRFSAGIIGAPVTNRHSFFGTSDIGYHFGEHHCGSTPWEDADRLLQRSPLSFVDQVDTPVMIVHGEGDLRCPVAQAEEFYIALKRLDQDAVMVRYPDEFHGIAKPSHAEDRYRRYLAWFRHHLNL